MALLSMLPDFLKFLQQIPTSQLNGLHSQLASKIKIKIPDISFQYAKDMLLNFNGNIDFKIKRNWKQDEIYLLIYLIDKACLKTGKDLLNFQSNIWKQISLFIPSKSAQACFTKALSFFPTSINQRPWSQQEDQILKLVIENQGEKQWKKISLKLFEENPEKIYRNSKQCRQRYMCFLKPDLKKGFWNEQQDYQLICLFLEFGKKWSKISNFIEGRNQNAIKNRFFLLFQDSKNQTQYHSELLRRVQRKKQKLQKKFEIDQIFSINQKEQKNISKFDKVCDSLRVDDATQYEKFFSF